MMKRLDKRKKTKLRRMLAMALTVVGIAVMVPMSSVNALKKAALLEKETEEAQACETKVYEAETRESEAAEMQESQIQESQIQESQIQESQIQESQIQESQIQETEIQETEIQIEALTDTEQLAIEESAVIAQNQESKAAVSVKIEDSISKSIDYQNGSYLKKAQHTITLTKNQPSALESYQSISYAIYEKTDDGGNNLKEGSLEIPNEDEKYSINQIETAYTHAGDYYIIIKGSLKQENADSETSAAEVELACHDFSINREKQRLMLKKNTVSLEYGDTLYVDELIRINQKGAYPIAYEIREENEEKNKILEIGKEDIGDYIRAIGINDADIGTTRVSLKIKENPFMEASEEKILEVNVNPIKLSLSVQIDETKIYMYNTLTVKVTLQRDGEDAMEEILAMDEDLSICFQIASNAETCEINSENLKCEKGSSYIFYIPVIKEYFKEFSKGIKFNITAALQYADNKDKYLPYEVNTAAENVELLGRRAELSLSAENNGIYDYRTCYKGTTPVLGVEIKDAAALSNEPEEVETGQTALSDEAEAIVYTVSSTNKNVAVADSTKIYTAKDGKIPLCINGVGTATLTVKADGGSVYTVKSASIRIEVRNSPLYDEDFVISIVDENGVKKRSFHADTEKTGFEKWQEYLSECNGWVRDSVRISLTENGRKYYERMRLTKNGHAVREAEQLQIEGDRAIAEYVFWAENDSTNADTSASNDEINGIRGFQMGIDATAPAIKAFVPSTDYYTPTSTETKQYFAKSFVLTGSFTDVTSGVAAIEYTTDINAKEETKWELLESCDKAEHFREFRLELGNGCYNAVALRAVDAAGNISEPVCLKNENGAFIQVIVDDTPSDIRVLAMSDGSEYHGENEDWTNKEIQFSISENLETASNDERVGTYAGLYRVEYAYKSIAAVLYNEPIGDEEWKELDLDEEGIAVVSVGGSDEEPVNKNGCYYFRGVSKTGVKSEESIEKRILLWQEPAPKKPIVQTGAAIEKCHNGWYNKESGTPILDFEYPEYDTGVISKEYAAPITLHYNLSVKDEKDITTTLADDRTAKIQAYIPERISVDNDFTGFSAVSDDLSLMQVTFPADGIYTLEYWITDAAGNESETEICTYKIDCHEPTDLKVIVADEELALGNESALVYDKFYQDSVTGSASAAYGISGKEGIRLIKAKRIGDWDKASPVEDGEQFCLEPNMRCLLYIEAVDGAGNTAQGWTRGIVVDNEAPIGEGGQEMIVEPKGANKHGFFNKDVKVEVHIKDAPTDKNSAALKLVTGSVGTNGVDTISEKELFSSLEEVISEAQLEETESFTVVEIIHAGANEGNEAYVTVSAADRSGNRSSYTQMLKIDVTKPEIEITFDNENAVNGRYYSSDRRAKINIRELNFDSSLVEIKAKKDGKEFTPTISEWKSEKNNHYAYVAFTEDGDYELTVGCRDLADNEADKVSAEPFTIDKTMPKVGITLENKESVNAREGYFNGEQIAVITVTEHNFNAEDFQINVQPAGKMSAWEHKNDTHVIKVALLSEGEYDISCDYKDLAGNMIAAEDKEKMPLKLIVDRTNPVIEISGVEDNSANAGVVVPVIMVLDANMEPESAAVTLTTGRGTVVDISADITTALTTGGFIYTLNGLDAKADDIYYLTVGAADKAGNTEEMTCRFSLNRRGSAYDLTDLVSLMDRYYSSYNTLEDIKITEMNIDRVEDFELYLSYNADMIYGAAGSRPSNPNQSSLPKEVLYSVDVSGNEDTGYVYTYTIYRENFALEGTYRLGIYSKDRAGNEVNNLLKQNGEEIQFIIDNTMPRVVIDGVENNKLYDVEAQEVCIIADDNFKLAEAELILVNSDNEVLERWNYFDFAERAGDTACISIGERSEEVSLLYRAVDAAGNEIKIQQGEKQAKEEFLVTTDKLVQFVNKPTQTPLGRFIIIAAVLFTAGLILTGLALKSFKRFRSN